MVANSKHLSQKEWKQYVSYLDKLNAYSDKVWREYDEPDRQYPSQQEDFRDEIDRNIMYEELYKQMKTLTPREMIVLIGYFGIETQYPLTFRQMGTFLELTQTRVQQIQQKALRKLRHPLRSKGMRRMLEELGEDRLSVY